MLGLWERCWSGIKSRFAKSTGNEGGVSVAERSAVWWTERREPGQSASVVQDLFRSLVVSVSVATAGNYACRSLWLALRLNQVLCHTVLDRVVVEAVSRRNWLRVEVAGHLHIREEVSAFQLDLIGISASSSSHTTPEVLDLGPPRGVYTLGAPEEAPRGKHMASIRAGARTETGGRYGHQPSRRAFRWPHHTCPSPILLSASTDLMPHEKLAGIGVAAKLAGEE